MKKKIILLGTLMLSATLLASGSFSTEVAYRQTDDGSWKKVEWTMGEGNVQVTDKVNLYYSVDRDIYLEGSNKDKEGWDTLFFAERKLPNIGDWTTKARIYKEWDNLDGGEPTRDRYNARYYLTKDFGNGYTFSFVPKIYWDRSTSGTKERKIFARLDTNNNYRSKYVDIDAYTYYWYGDENLTNNKEIDVELYAYKSVNILDTPLYVKGLYGIEGYGVNVESESLTHYIEATVGYKFDNTFGIEDLSTNAYVSGYRYFELGDSSSVNDKTYLKATVRSTYKF